MAEDRSSAGYGDSNESSIWRGLRTLIFGGGQEESLRDQLEEAIDRHEDDPGPDAKGDLTPLERQMVRNLLHFGERDAGDVGVPRADIIAVEENTTFAHLVQIFAEAGHSRLPVYRGQLDTIIGMVHIKDVFNILATGAEHPTSIAGLIREPLYVPMSRGALDLLADMRQRHVHLAIVLDEYSGTEGLVTIEDLIEEIVGEIEDEHDVAQPPTLARRNDGTLDVNGRTTVELLEKEIGNVLSEDERREIDTVGGLIFSLLGRIPERGEVVRHPSGVEFEILDVDPRRIRRLRVRPPVSSPPAG